MIDYILAATVIGLCLRELWWSKRYKDDVIVATTQRVLAGNPQKNDDAWYRDDLGIAPGAFIFVFIPAALLLLVLIAPIIIGLFKLWYGFLSYVIVL